MRRGSSIAYSCERRWPGPQVVSTVEVEVGAPLAAADLSVRDHFLTARWVLFSRGGWRERFARVFHEPWLLQRASARVHDDALLQAAGLPASNDEPIVHYSPGVDVRIGRPEREPA